MESQRNNEQVLGAGDRPTRRGKGRKIDTHLLSRRAFLGQAGKLAAALALVQTSGILSERGWLEPAYAAQLDVVRDTLNGLIAFIVPGPDDYSVRNMSHLIKNQCSVCNPDVRTNIFILPDHPVFLLHCQNRLFLGLRGLNRSIHQNSYLRWGAIWKVFTR